MKHIKTYQLFESVQDTKEQIEEIISTCKDILLEANDTFSSNSNVERSYKDDKLIITCVYKLPFFAPRKIEEYKSAIDDIHSRLIEYMTSQGFTYINRGNTSTAYFDIILGNITYKVFIKINLDREFIGHIPRNIRMITAAADLMKPYININDIKNNTLNITLLGCNKIETLEIYSIPISESSKGLSDMYRIYSQNNLTCINNLFRLLE